MTPNGNDVWNYPDGSQYITSLDGRGGFTEQFFYPEGDDYIRFTDAATGVLIWERWSFYLPDGIKYTYVHNNHDTPHEQWEYPDGSVYWTQDDPAGNKREGWIDPDGNETSRTIRPD